MTTIAYRIEGATAVLISDSMRSRTLELSDNTFRNQTSNEQRYERAFLVEKIQNLQACGADTTIDSAALVALDEALAQVKP